MEKSIKINIKPLSVNKAWQGRRFKTLEYANYENSVLFMLPKLVLPDPPYEIYFKVGYSNKASDIDNFLKPILDILCKKYKFDDRNIYMLFIKKVIVKKGCEFIEFIIKHSDN